ncbi:hypothetical protein CK203_034627 [Vitis vinifera]|uniref:Retrovirus-related Pol polyprotein from transposon TNT 1-94 n=1 Tax=Vitis vinifera TaxID=29760 RepID=A0A438IEV4_VITVI|nr:hypothetical protein CK203_034627 [Vitis vinifera]
MVVSTMVDIMDQVNNVQDLYEILTGMWHYSSVTILGTPSQNGISERRNWTLKDMMDNAKFIEGVEYGGSTGLRNFVFEEEYVIFYIATENDQMDVKTVFLNGDNEETIYMVQLENFESK